MMNRKRQQQHMIKALKSNDLASVRAILNEKNELLEDDLDGAGTKAIHVAAFYSNLDVVQFLINLYKMKYLHYFDQINQPNQKGFVPLMLALMKESYAAADLIMHTALHEDNHDSVFRTITSAVHALELMIFNPKNAALMRKNAWIKQLIKNQSHRSEHDETKGFYKVAGRKPSFYATLNHETDQIDLYQPQCFLGEGSYAHVRMFTSAEGASIAVKTPHQNALGTSVKTITDSILDYKNEQNIMRRAYNTVRGCNLFYFKPTDAQDTPKATLRSIMPYIDGEQYRTYLAQVDCSHTLAQVILAMTEALMKLHQNDIIHGDIKVDNIMISNTPSLKVTFVDFGLSYLKTDKTASIFPQENRSRRAHYLAPERFLAEERDVPPHTNQDVYSFAYNLQHYIIKDHKNYAEFSALYPSIITFTEEGQSLVPEDRPSLESFYDALSNEIREQTAQLQATEVAPGCETH